MTRGDDDVAERAPGAVLRAHGLQAGAEVGEPRRGSAAERIAGEVVGVGAGGDQVAVEALAGGGDDVRDRGGADAAARRLDGAPEGLRVARVGQQREVGERVADLGALVEAERAEHAVRDPGGGQRGLDRARWRTPVRASTRISPGGVPAASASAISAGGPGGLVAVEREPARGDPPARAARGHQRLRVAVLVVRDAAPRRRSRISARERKLRASTTRSWRG